jgi:hypothetical protein
MAIFNKEDKAKYIDLSPSLQALIDSKTPLVDFWAHRDDNDRHINEGEREKWNRAYRLANGALRSGIIVAWSGSVIDIPEDYYLCDGNNGTPDLRDRFIMGAGGEHAPGNYGGEMSHILKKCEMPAHSHSSAQFGHDEGDAGKGSYSFVSLTCNLGTVNVGGGSAGNDQPHNNLPPYYALCYIMYKENGIAPTTTPVKIKDPGPLPPNLNNTLSLDGKTFRDGYSFPGTAFALYSFSAYASFKMQVDFFYYYQANETRSGSTGVEVLIDGTPIIQQVKSAGVLSQSFSASGIIIDVGEGDHTITFAGYKPKWHGMTYATGWVKIKTI